MSSHLPQNAITKIAPPELHGILERPHLSYLIDQQRTKHRVLWLAAPPGSGKTTLLASYARRQPTRTIWYQLDEGDADPGTWFYYLGLANKKNSPRYRKPLPKLAPENWPSLPSFTRRFFEEFFRRLKTPTLMVWDNFQDLPEQAPTLELLRIAIQSMSEGHTMVVISRTEPPALYASLQIGQTIGEIAPEVLALTPQEIEVLTTMHGASEQGPALQKKRSQRLHSQAKGWIAGTLLLMKQTTESDSASSPQEILSTAPVLFDYLAKEVLLCQPPTYQDILLKTALFPAFTAEMAKQITGQTNAPSVLRKLVRGQYFLERRPGTQDVFQYHPLFRQFLRDYLQESWPESSIQELQASSVTILCQAEWIEEAIELALTSNLPHLAIPLALESAPQLLAQGRAQILESWIIRLPEPIIDSTPWLGFWRARCRFCVNPSESVELFNLVYQQFQEANDSIGMLLTGCGAIHAILGSLVEWTRLDAWLASLQSLFEKQKKLLPEEIVIQVTCAIFLAMSHRRLEDPDMDEWACQTIACLERVPDPTQRVCVAHYLFIFQGFRGNFREGALTLQRMRQWIESNTIAPLGHILYANDQAIQSWSQGNGQACEDAYESGRDTAMHSGLDHCLGLILAQGVTGALLKHDQQRAQRLLEEMTPMLEHAPGALGAPYQHVAGLVAHMQNDPVKAEFHYQTGLRLCEELGVEFFVGLFRFGLGQLQVDQGKYPEAERTIATLQQQGKHINSATLTFFGLWLEAALGFKQNKPQEAIQKLQALFQLGQSLGISYQMGLLPAVMSELCAKSLEYGIEEDYARLLIRTHRLQPPEGHPSTSWPTPIQITTLGSFSIVVNNNPVSLGKKVPKRPLQLLKALIALGGKDVTTATLVAHLWSDAEGDLAIRSLMTTVWRLRKIIGDKEAIQISGKLVSLNPQLCWVDSVTFEQLVNTADERYRQGLVESSIPLYEQACLLYQGPFLPQDDQESWTFQPRTRFEQSYRHVVKRLHAAYQETGQWKQAIALMDQIESREGRMPDRPFPNP